MRERKEKNARKSGTTLVCQIQPSFHAQAGGDVCRPFKGHTERQESKERDRRRLLCICLRKKIFRFRTAIWNRRLFEREMLWSSPHGEIIEANKKKKIFHKLQGHNVNHTKASWEPVVAFVCVRMCVYVPSISSLNKVCWIKLKGLGSRHLPSGCNQLSHKIFTQCRESAVIERLFWRNKERRAFGLYSQGPGLCGKLAETARPELWVLTQHAHSTWADPKAPIGCLSSGALTRMLKWDCHSCLRTMQYIQRII